MSIHETFTPDVNKWYWFFVTKKENEINSIFPWQVGHLFPRKAAVVNVMC